MSGRLPYGERVHYPHMTVIESKVWEKYMIAKPKSFETVDYDFRVGRGIELPEDYGDNWKRMAKMLSQKRIDVIGWVGDSPTIIEVKQRVGAGTIGQVLTYKTLFEEYFKNIELPELLIICEMISNDDFFVLEKNRIQVFEV